MLLTFVSIPFLFSDQIHIDSVAFKTQFSFALLTYNSLSETSLLWQLRFVSTACIDKQNGVHLLDFIRVKISVQDFDFFCLQGKL